MKTTDYAVVELGREEMAAIDGGGLWEEFKALMQKEFADAADGWRDAGKV